MSSVKKVEKVSKNITVENKGFEAIYDIKTKSIKIFKGDNLIETINVDEETNVDETFLINFINKKLKHFETKSKKILESTISRKEKQKPFKDNGKDYEEKTKKSKTKNYDDFGWN